MKAVSSFYKLGSRMKECKSRISAYHSPCIHERITGGLSTVGFGVQEAPPREGLWELCALRPRACNSPTPPSRDLQTHRVNFIYFSFSKGSRTIQKSQCEARAHVHRHIHDETSTLS